MGESRMLVASAAKISMTTFCTSFGLELASQTLDIHVHDAIKPSLNGC